MDVLPLLQFGISCFPYNDFEMRGSPCRVCVGGWSFSNSVVMVTAEQNAGEHREQCHSLCTVAQITKQLPKRAKLLMSGWSTLWLMMGEIGINNTGLCADISTTQ